MSAWQALCSFQTRLGPGLWGWGTPAWAHWGWDGATPLLSPWSVHRGDRWVLDMSFREMGAWQGPVGGDSTHQNAQEQSGTWVPAPDREMKGPEQRSLPAQRKEVLSFWRISLWQKLVGPGWSSPYSGVPAASLLLAHGELLLPLLWHHFTVKITPEKYKGRGRDCL